MRAVVIVCMAAVVALTAAVGSTQEATETDQGFRLHLDFALNWRDSSDLEFAVPPPVLGGASATLRTPSPGGSGELSNVSLSVDAALAENVHGRARVTFIDLYTRNPTSSDERVFLREAWVLFGRRAQPLEELDESPIYLLVGKAPRFTRHEQRRLESYGLWGVAVGWLEQVQLQLGGRIGNHLYWRAYAANPNPLYMRDTNALAGESRADPTQTIGSGFPILYDARAPDLNTGGRTEVGGGLGVRFLNRDTHAGLDLLLWVVKREMEDEVEVYDGGRYGDLELLREAGLPFHGRDKREAGANLNARIGGLRVFAEAVDQDIAGLGRKGFEVEVAYRFQMPGIVVAGDQLALTWIQPAVRYSKIDNDFRFVAPVELAVAPSLVWDWDKLDTGIRLGLMRGIDLTVEYAHHNMILLSGRKLHPDEALATLHVGLGS